MRSFVPQQGPLRAVIYTRYSSDRQNPLSLEDQTSLCRKYITNRGWSLIDVYGDAHISGRSANRPEYQRMIKDAQNGAFDVVVVEAIDRVARRLADVASLHDDLAYAGQELHTPQLGMLTDLHIAILGYVAQAFSKDLGVHTWRGQQGAASDRRRHMGPVPYGYRKADPEANGGLNRLIDPEEAEIVRRVFTEYASGKSPERIAGDLNREGIAFKDGKPWRNTTLRGQAIHGTGVLRNRLYVGLMDWNRRQSQVNPRSGKKRFKPNTAEDWVTVEIPELRIIDDELWNTVQQRLMQKRQATEGRQRTQSATYLLSGTMVCNQCGSRYVITSKDRYGCANRNRGTRTCSNEKTILRKHVERRALQCLKSELLSPDNVRRFVSTVQAEQAARRRSAKKARARLEKRLLEAQDAVNNLLALMEQGRAPASLLARLSERENEVAQVEQELASLEPEDDGLVLELPNLAEAYRRKIDRLTETLDHPGYREEAAQHLQGMIEKIVMIPDEHAPQGLAMEVHGALAAIAAFCNADKKRPLAAAAAKGQIAVVAGAGFEPATFRL